MDSLAGPFWLAAYCLVPPLLVAVVWRQLREPGAEAPSGRPLPTALRGVLAAQGAVMLGVGVALFAAPTKADDLWAWMLTPLTARAVGAFVTGFGLAALLAAVDADSERYRGAALAYLMLGLLELLAIALFGDDLRDGDVRTTLYSLFLVTVVLAGAWGVSATRPRASRAAPGSS
jgi:hypothetical protein